MSFYIPSDTAVRGTVRIGSSVDEYRCYYEPSDNSCRGFAPPEMFGAPLSQEGEIVFNCAGGTQFYPTTIYALDYRWDEWTTPKLFETHRGFILECKELEVFQRASEAFRKNELPGIFKVSNYGTKMIVFAPRTFSMEKVKTSIGSEIDPSIELTYY